MKDEVEREDGDDGQEPEVGGRDANDSQAAEEEAVKASRPEPAKGAAPAFSAEIQRMFADAVGPRLEELRKQVSDAARPQLADLQKKLADAARPHLADLAGKLADAARPELSDLAGKLADAARPGLADLPKIERFQFPQLVLSQSYLDDLRERLQAAQPDLSSLLQKITVPVPDLSGLRERLRDLTREWLPPNWPYGLDPDLAFSVIQDEGIPLVWVPRADIVSELLDAADREERLKVLVSRADEVAEDCAAALSEVTNSELVNQVPLARRAVAAYAAGHHEAAQALAVVVVETAVSHTVKPKKTPGRKSSYERIAEAVKVDDPGKLSLTELRLRAALAPIGPFYVSWYPTSGDPAPEELSRHVTVHQAHIDHYTQGNAAVAVMMVASVLRGLQEMLESPTTP